MIFLFEVPQITDSFVFQKFFWNPPFEFFKFLEETDKKRTEFKEFNAKCSKSFFEMIEKGDSIEKNQKILDGYLDNHFQLVSH